MPYAEVNNTRLYCETKGGGPPVLLIAGLACDCRAWANQTGPLSRRFTVIAYDHRGIGKSADAPPDFSLADLASDAAGMHDGTGRTAEELRHGSASRGGTRNCRGERGRV